MPRDKPAGQLPAAFSAPSFPAELPITPRIGEIVELVRRHQVVIVAGETGSGKTTQLPKACLLAGVGARGGIVHTQPRRLAARTVASRIASELGVDLGAEVGYAVRFSDQTSPRTVIKVVTDGLLLNEIQRDRTLKRYACVIVDEAHERSLNVDFILGCLKFALARRPDLKVIVTSATIDVAAFADYFGGAPIVEVSGRGYPVETVYLPPEESLQPGSARGLPLARESLQPGSAPAAKRRAGALPLARESPQRGSARGLPLARKSLQPGSAPAAKRQAGALPLAREDPESALVDCLERIARDAPAGRRDILVFQSGEREIFDNAHLLKKRFGDRFDILPLYARLPSVEQQRVFAPGDRQRVVLATNVAETSITVPNIGYVIDPGLARISRYSYRAKLQRLPIEPISQASAAQRAGRCGRVAPGVCYRLYGEADHQSRPAYTDPELKRTNLAAVVLTMRAFRFGDVEAFGFIEPPDPRAVRDAVRLLHELEALADDRLTGIGRTMARLPVDPRLARVLIEAGRTGALAEALIVVSALSAQDPRLRPLDRRAAADEAHALFDQPTSDEIAGRAPKSDFVAFVRLWNWLEANRTEMSRSAFRRLLESRYLSPARIREWRALHRQLLLACRDLGLRVNRAPADYATLHRALLTGSLGFIGSKRDVEADAPRSASVKRGRRRMPEYDGPRGMRFRVFPGSSLRDAQPKWLVAAEISIGASRVREAGATYARCVGAVEPAWIEAAAEHIKRTSHSEPYWDAKRGQAMVRERVTVYGLTLVAGRPRSAREVDPDAAREMFLLEALVRRHAQPVGKRVNASFLDRNEALGRRVAQSQARARRAGLVASEKARAAFYAARLPADIDSVDAWERFEPDLDDAARERLVMDEADLLVGTTPPVSDDDFPSYLDLAGQRVALAYKFAPGEPDDGVSVRVDLSLLAQLDAPDLDWLVPGFFAEKCEALLRALPKSLRRQLAPIPDRVEAVVRRLSGDEYRQGNLYAALSAAIRATTGVVIPVSGWRADTLPDHLRINVQVRGRRGRVTDQDRDVAALRARLLAEVERTIARDVGRDQERFALTEFPLEGVPESVVLGAGAGRVVAYPVLVDRGNSVDLLIHATPKQRRALSRGGYARLALLADAPGTRYLRREVEHDTALALRYAPIGPLADLADDVMLAAAWYAFFEGRELPTVRSAFDERLAASGASLVPVFQGVLDRVRVIVDKRFELARRLDALNSPALAETRADLCGQLDSLAGPRFLAALPSERVGDLPRYLDGMAMRLDGLQGRVARDREGMAAVAAWERRLARLAAADEDVTELRFLVQEFRVATFSQRIGTKGKVSAKRLEARFAAAEANAALDGDAANRLRDA
ncbi:MAG: ATP-dependent RNA helicase HrpA [Gammaproteobacteria bacterium]|nr:ATP-dependent RNA helicase HrpA [Gammaproteobacteria bacterium]